MGLSCAFTWPRRSSWDFCHSNETRFLWDQNIRKYRPCDVLPVTLSQVYTALKIVISLAWRHFLAEQLWCTFFYTSRKCRERLSKFKHLHISIALRLPPVKQFVISITACHLVFSHMINQVIYYSTHVRCRWIWLASSAAIVPLFMRRPDVTLYKFCLIFFNLRSSEKWNKWLEVSAFVAWYL